MIYLYLKTHNTTGLKYLGQTKNDPVVYQGSGKHWMRHIKKHGYDVTTTILYETPFIEEIKELGLYFSDLWNIVDSKEFANMMVESGAGGSGNTGKTLSEEAKQKISEFHSGNKYNLGKTHSEEAKRKMSEAKKGKNLSEEHRRKIGEKSKGKTVSDETKQKMSESAKGKPKSEEHRRKIIETLKGNPNMGMLGKTHSEETKRKMSEARKGKTLSEETKQKRKTTCPHCGKTGGSNVIKRWHFDNCNRRKL